MSLTSLFVRVIPEPLLDVNFLSSLFIFLLTSYFVAFSDTIGAASFAIDILFFKLIFLLKKLVVVYLQLIQQEFLLFVSSYTIEFLKLLY